MRNPGTVSLSCKSKCWPNASQLLTNSWPTCFSVLFRFSVRRLAEESSNLASKTSCDDCLCFGEIDPLASLSSSLLRFAQQLSTTKCVALAQQFFRNKIDIDRRDVHSKWSRKCCPFRADLVDSPLNHRDLPRAGAQNQKTPCPLWSKSACQQNYLNLLGGGGK